MYEDTIMKTQEFLDAIAEGLQRDPGSITLEDTPETVEEWDSVGHLTIISTIDSELGIEPDTEDLMGFTSIKQLIEALKGRGALEN